MASLTMVWLPILVLVAMATTGLAIGCVVAARMPADARAALSVPAGAGLLALCSPLLLIGVPVRWLVLGGLMAGVVAALALRRRVAPSLRAGAAPGAVAVAALALLSIPWITHSSWEAATYGNADPYLWVSQARAYVETRPCCVGRLPRSAGVRPDLGSALAGRAAARGWGSGCGVA